MKALNSHRFSRCLAGLCLVLAASGAWAHCAGKHTGDHPHCTDGGDDGDGGGGADLIYTADNDYLIKEPIDSSGVSKLQIVFRHTKMDLSDFTLGKVFFDSGNECIPGPISGQGIMVLQPKSRKFPAVAALQYWFEGELESLDVVTYLLEMEGVFDEQDNWPPTEADPETTLSFNYWKLAAENKWAQKQDCSGEYFDGSYPWTVKVSLKP